MTHWRTEYCQSGDSQETDVSVGKEDFEMDIYVIYLCNLPLPYSCKKGTVMNIGTEFRFTIYPVAISLSLHRQK